MTGVQTCALPISYRDFRRLQHALRLNGAQYARVPLDQVAADSEAVRKLWTAVFAAYRDEP